MNLLFGVHNHQPVGNFESVFKKANQDCYHPFIDTLYNYPNVKATLHFSGSLIDWLLKNDCSLLEKVKEMVNRGQVEILSGGYYEPILPIIPERDRIGQINMLSSFIKDYFGCLPSGAWIGERVWEPALVTSLVQAGIKYILLDDYHFRLVGMEEKHLWGYYLTNLNSQSLAIFPINKRLRYLLPFSPAPKALSYLEAQAREKEDLTAIIVDDGEKFGLWPGTHKWVYHQKWLEKFFQLLNKNQDWLHPQTISEYMGRHKPAGLCNLPSASYEEMMAWSGGQFSNFFAKYPEANNLRQRMLYLSARLNKEKSSQEATRYLYMAQCNCPYWHGVFGGIYLTHLRHNAYKNLIHSQALLDEKRQLPWVEIEAFDFDKDGADELLLKSKLLNIFVAPKQGGAIFELDYIPGCVNLMDVLTRRPEAYHQKIGRQGKSFFKKSKDIPATIHDLLGSKEKGLRNSLIYDSYRRLSLLDHFFPASLTLKELQGVQYEELGNFINAPYAVKHHKTDRELSLILQREGKVKSNYKEVPIRISKKLSLNNKDAAIYIEYKLENLSAKILELIFAVEFNIALGTCAQPNNLRCNEESADKSYSLKEGVHVCGVKDARLQDVLAGVETALHFENMSELWSYPLETVSASESGFECNYQQTVVFASWPIKLEKNWQTNFTIAVSRF